MANRRNPWQDAWAEVDNRAMTGGQGKVCVVRRMGDSGTGARFALKVLKDQKNMERRQRMHREVAALETLKHPGIQQCEDSNADKFADASVPLYMVTEYVPGPTLGEYVGMTPADLAFAVGCALKLLEIIEYCHVRNVVHRDIKPDNIILRDGDPFKPVLLDFGLSFNEEPAVGSVTWTGQELGNRFLHLPELQHPGPGQRDGRADLTQWCGILFHLVTGETPRTLRDQDGKKPHEREKAAAILNSLESDQRDRLFAVFEQGFEQEIDRRFQTVDEVRLGLTGTLIGYDGEEEARKVKSIKAAIGLSDIHQRNRRYVALLEKAGAIIDEVGRELAEELFGEHWCVDKDYELDTANLRLSMKRSLKHTGHPDKSFVPRFIGTITQSQLRLAAIEDTGKFSPIFFSPIEGATDWMRCRADVRRFFIDGIYEVFASRSLTPLTRPLPELSATGMSRSELSAQLRQLPLRAIVAFAARCARRIQSVLDGKDNDPPGADLLARVGDAIASADGYARGDATVACGVVANEAMSAATLLLGTKEGTGQLDFRRSDAAQAAASAASAALFARQNDGNGTVACALEAYQYACSVQPACCFHATLDLRCLLTSDLGQFPNLGFPVEPGDSGPLGPVRP